ncbi:MAG: energy-coupling factor transporter transmembrane protein EcfT [Oscillospiraceae bacterium]|nr:energy-coupling factor transporter transmembrane protein EcfT [Oscillospiraceae bacterium]
MGKRDCFSGYHPLVNFSYFALVLIFSMCFMHPACLLISLLCALCYNIYLNGRKAVRFCLLFMLPLMLLTMIINPAFNHEGVTILTYLPSGNPLTLESMAYGVAAAAMLVAVILWFSSFSKVISTDKFVYLFGRIIPALSLVLSMMLRFLPRFRAQIGLVSESQRCIGRDISDGGILQRARNGITILSIMITWALENAIETADSMKSRGYGLPGRSAFSIYRFDRRDTRAMVFLLACTAYIIAGWVLGATAWRYFPSMKGMAVGLYPLTVFAVYLALCILPFVLNLKEDRKWIRLQSAA